MIAHRCVLVALCLEASLAGAQGAPQWNATTGAPGTPGPAPSVRALGGNGPRFALYLRSVGGIGDRGRLAIAAALAALARIPAAKVELYIEPNDREGPALANLLAELPSDSARWTFLLALIDRDLPRWTDPASMAKLVGSLGIPMRAQRRGGPGRFYSSAPLVAGVPLLRRPSGLVHATESFLALGGTLQPLSLDDVDVIAMRERLSVVPERTPAATTRVPEAIGGALAAHQLVVRVAAPLSPVLRGWLVAAFRLLDGGRLRMLVEVDEVQASASTGGNALVNLALKEAIPAIRVRLLRQLLSPELAPAELEVATADWLIPATGTDPTPLHGARAVWHRPSSPQAGTPTLTLDGAALSLVDARELERRCRLPSLKSRLGEQKR